MNCALIDDDIDDEDDLVVVSCAVDGDGIMSTGMHEKRGEEDKNGGKGTRRGVVVDDGSRRGTVSGGRNNNTRKLAQRTKIPPRRLYCIYIGKNIIHISGARVPITGRLQRYLHMDDPELHPCAE